MTQEQLRQAAELQAAVWLAEKEAREFVQDIERRLRDGAKTDPGELVFDRTLEMVRTARKTGSEEG